MYQALFPEGQIECERYEREDDGVVLYSAADEFLAFVPYESLHAIINEDVEPSDQPDERSVM
jgi:hypothetical protein